MRKDALQPLADVPTIFVIFGITGDLAGRKLLPALLSLYARRMLPTRFSIVGVSRRLFTREEFREFIRSRLNVKLGEFKEEDIKHFLDHMTYEQGMFDGPDLYNQLKKTLESIDDKWKQCSNKLFHLSVPPHLYENILRQISDSRLSKPCSDKMGWTRVLIEKPFGHNSETAKSLDKLLGNLFKEEQIFRIDHYLAKEALQNILAFRFSNPIFESMWSNEFIDKVHVKLYERHGMEGRGAYFDPVGSLRDVGQNHMLMMLSVIAMDAPKILNPDTVRRERAKVVSALKQITKRNVMRNVVRGQYIGYQAERGVAVNSTTETYFRIKAELENDRWKGVPFYMESGKMFAESKTEIDIYFKPDKKSLFAKHPNESGDAFMDQNVLTFRIQPEECIKIKFFVKTPGFKTFIEPKTLKFKYSDVSSFDDIPNDYERLIHDAFIGDQTLFASTPEIMASWKFVMSVINSWNSVPLIRYDKGVREIE